MPYELSERYALRAGGHIRGTLQSGTPHGRHYSGCVLHVQKRLTVPAPGGEHHGPSAYAPYQHITEPAARPIHVAEHDRREPDSGAAAPVLQELVGLPAYLCKLSVGPVWGGLRYGPVHASVHPQARGIHECAGPVFDRLKEVPGSLYVNAPECVCVAHHRGQRRQMKHAIVRHVPHRHGRLGNIPQYDTGPSRAAPLQPIYPMPLRFQRPDQSTAYEPGGSYYQNVPQQTSIVDDSNLRRRRGLVQKRGIKKYIRSPWPAKDQ